jgi:prolyl oligopeptidase
MSIARRALTGTAVFASSLAFVCASATPANLRYPPTKTVPVSDSYFGTVVADPYRWLEDPNDPAVKTWAAAQTKLALDEIDASPAYAGYKARIAELSRTSTSRFRLLIRGERLFYERQTPPEQQPQLVVRDSLTGTERVLFDPKAAAGGGPEPSIETVAVSNDGAKVAFTTQLGGSEDETLHVVDAIGGQMLADILPHVGGGTSPVAIAWDGDGKGFVHTLWPKKPDGTYATAGILLFHHALATDPSADTYVFGNRLSPKAEYNLRSSLDGTVSAAVVTDGDGVHASVYLRRGAGPFTLVATPKAGIGDSGDSGGTFVGDAFYAVAHERDSRGEIVALVPGGSFETARVVVPASSVVVTGLVPVAGGFITSDTDGGDGSARFFAADGTLRNQLPIPKISTLTALAGDPKGGPIVIGYYNYTTPSKWLAYDAAINALSETGIAETAPGDFSNIVAERVFVPSLDGKVKIPLEIVHAKNVKLDGTAPTIMAAYGAYGIISRPFFDSPSLAWLERGGVIAQAMIRGGGEYGEAWHQAARLSTKTVSSDDVAACAMWLARNGYGDAHHLGIIGGSAGGFLMGLALTRNPALYRAVVSDVGIYDLLRVELTPNGAYNTPEFGTVKNPAQFAWMLKQSPYHNVHKGTAYPAVLMTTGENDPRVDPYMSRKMVAMLQADTAPANPVFLIQRSGQGHGIGNSFDQQVEEATEIDTFFDSQLR